MVHGVGDLPRGTLTFLFTDLEGSTRLWQEQPDAMASALARHDELLANAITAAGGTVFKHTGDGLHAAFADPAAGLRAAVDLQRAMSTESWGDVGALRVRVALHSGTAQLRDGDYFGPTLNRVARVLGVGHGGQILATAATIGLMPDTPAFDLGLHRLRDLTEPVHLYQIEAPGLARTFPPLRSLERFHHNLPVQRSTFIGREREIAKARALLGRSRLLTLTGVGGCGKTRLALAVAAQELDRFPDGVFFVDLSVLSDGSLVWNAVAEAVRITGPSGAARGESLAAREAVLRYLTPATVLLLLHNCEHLVDECATVVHALLDRCPSALVLATSREPLAVEGEQLFRVPPSSWRRSMRSAPRRVSPALLRSGDGGGRELRPRGRERGNGGRGLPETRWHPPGDRTGRLPYATPSDRGDRPAAGRSVPAPDRCPSGRAAAPPDAAGDHRLES
jgi:class 3 adenylate cyclase